MSHKRRREEPSAPANKWLVQAATIGGVLLLVAVVFIFKGISPAEDPLAIAVGTPQATATLPEAVGQTQATAELDRVAGPVAATAPGVQGAALPDDLPEAQLERHLTAGKPTLAFFHSNSCVQCIKMMEVVEQVYPEFDGSVALVDVNVYDQANARLLQVARIRAIPTQIFFDRTGQGTVIMGAMTPDQFREQMQTLAGGQ